MGDFSTKFGRDNTSYEEVMDHNRREGRPDQQMGRTFKKSDLSKCSNYMGITLLSVPWKVLNQVILGRLKDAVFLQLRHQRRNRSCADHIDSFHYNSAMVTSYASWSSYLSGLGNLHIAFTFLSLGLAHFWQQWNLGILCLLQRNDLYLVLDYAIWIFQSNKCPPVFLENMIISYMYIIEVFKTL